MTAEDIVGELKPLASEGYRKILLNHGAAEPCLGVKIGDMQPIRKRIGKDYQLALDLYDTGIYDAMYLAGLIADDSRMTRRDLNRWVKAASPPLAGSTVAWVAAGSPHGWEIANEWIDSKNPLVAATGWATLSSFVSITDDAELDLESLERLLVRVRDEIEDAHDGVRYQMNGFVICSGCYVKSLTKLAKEIGTAIGPLSVDMGETACQVPFAPDYIAKVENRGAIGKKRKTAKC